jgi:CHAT domain-containing protein
VAIPLLASLSDAPVFDPVAAYQRAEQEFVHGYLEAAQAEAERGYQRSLKSDSQWSRRFQILTAATMLWRSSDEALLILLSDNHAHKYSSTVDDDLYSTALEAQALIHLGRLPEATKKLNKASIQCELTPSAHCGSILLARGMLSFNLGKMVEAKALLLNTTDFAERSGDKMLEGTALLNLGSVLMRQEHYDEAINLYLSSQEVARGIGAEVLVQSALSGQGWAYDRMGNDDKALELYTSAEASASSIGDVVGELYLLTVMADLQANLGQFELAEASDIQAIKLARQVHRMESAADASTDLADTYIREVKPEEADRYASQALSLLPVGGNRVNVLSCLLIQGQAAALRHNWSRADGLLHEVALAPESENRMKWNAQHTLATVYEAQGEMGAAEQAYKAAIALVEGARADLKQELSQLTFLTNAAKIYDDYIHFLVAQGRGDEALEAADWSRARTLQQGLGVIPADASLKPPALHAKEIARKTNSTLLFYWLGERQSYLWAVAPAKTVMVTLPAKSEIVARMQRYRKTLLALRDPLRENDRQGDKDGRELYEMLVGPVAGMVAEGRPVVLLTDGEMSQLNFETLLVGSPAPHYWIEDATVSSAPSIRLFASKSGAASAAHEKLLLLGDSVSTDLALPHLPMAELEVRKVQAKFSPADEAVFSGPKATPLTYLESKPEQFAYIHFVAHGAASSTDPLESAVILSRDNAGEDSYKLYAREILQHPIKARLVTISACNSSGTKSYAGEGVVGLSWAFLRAGAHNTIGALWDVSDASTPELMDRLYTGLQENKPPAVALREAKLSLLHSQGSFGRPFYWAPFQLYSGH